MLKMKRNSTTNFNKWYMFEREPLRGEEKSSQA